MQAVAFLLVLVVLAMHGAGHLAAARALGHEVTRPWLYLVPGWGCFHCGHDHARRRWTPPIVHLGGLVGSYLGIAAMAFVVLVAFGVKESEGRWQVQDTVPGSGAHGKLLPGDIMMTVNDQMVTAPHQPLAPIIERAGGATVRIEVVRAGQTLQVEVQPSLDSSAGGYRLGVKLVIDRRYVTPPVGEALARALVEPARQLRQIASVVWGDDTLEIAGPAAISSAFERAFVTAPVRVVVPNSVMLAFLLVLVDVIAAVATAIQRRLRLR